MLIDQVNYMACTHAHCSHVHFYFSVISNILIKLIFFHNMVTFILKIKFEKN